MPKIFLTLGAKANKKYYPTKKEYNSECLLKAARVQKYLKRHGKPIQELEGTQSLAREGFV